MAFSEKLQRKIANLEKAFSKLEKSTTLTYKHEDKVELTIKRFEYTFEALWKSIKFRRSSIVYRL